MSEQQLITVGIEKAYAARAQQIDAAVAASRQGDSTAYRALHTTLIVRQLRRRPITEICAEYLAAARG